MRVLRSIGFAREYGILSWKGLLRILIQRAQPLNGRTYLRLILEQFLQAHVCLRLPVAADAFVAEEMLNSSLSRFGALEQEHIVPLLICQVHPLRLLLIVLHVRVESRYYRFEIILLHDVLILLH